MIRSWVELVALLVFASFVLSAVLAIALAAWALVRALQPPPITPPRIPTAGELVLRRDPVRVGAIWASLFLLIPLLVLAVWSVLDDVLARRFGVSLLFAIVHSFLLWQVVRYGARVQRAVVLTHSALHLQPVFGRAKDINWSAIDRVDDVRYAGFGVSGLYLHTTDGGVGVLDRGLPHWGWLRDNVFSLTPTAAWRVDQRVSLS